MYVACAKSRLVHQGAKTCSDTKNTSKLQEGTPMIRITSIAVAFAGSVVFGIPLVSPAAAQTCKSGFVWRVARPSDLVCVTPESRERVREENATASQRVQPGGG